MTYKSLKYLSKMFQFILNVVNSLARISNSVELLELVVTAKFIKLAKRMERTVALFVP